MALVVHREGRRLAVLQQPDERFTLGEALWSNFLKIYRVDVSEHALELQCHLPAETDAFYFFATVHVRCAVTDPLTVVELGITDVRVSLEPRVVDVMREVSRKFRVEDSADAEQEVTKALRDRVRQPGFCPGLEVRNLSVRLDLEEAARKHVRDLKEQERQHLREVQEGDRRHLRELEEAARRHVWELEEAKRRHTEEVARFSYDLERAQLQGDVEALKARLEIERSEKYLPLIQEGNWSLLALFLAQNPAQVSDVVNVMMGQQQLMLDKQLETLRFFLDKDVIEKSDYENRGRELLSNALQQLSAGSKGDRTPMGPTHALGNAKVVDPGVKPAPARVVDPGVKPSPDPPTEDGESPP